ncbi:MAG: A24 family peptidase [Bdellovibrionota bacterium]
MEQLSALAFAVGLVGGVHDLFTRRIPNWLTFPALILGIAAQFWLGGWAGGADALLGVLLGFALYFPIHFLGYMGAGDVKLLMAIGACTGWRVCLQVGVLAVLIGAVYALVEVIYRGRLKAVVLNIYSFMRALMVPGLVAEPLRLDKTRHFAFGICIALGLGSAIYLRHSGRLP